MQLLGVRQNEGYRQITYRRKHITWTLSARHRVWESISTIDARFLVPIPAHFSTLSVS